MGAPIDAAERTTPAPPGARLLAVCARAYPFLSGCASLANHRLLRRLDGAPRATVWARVAGGAVLADLDDYVGRAAWYFGDLDRKISKLFARYVRSGDTVADIGANIGVTALKLAQLVGPHGRVVAFEPHPDTAARLRAAVARSGARQVDVQELALSDAAGTARLARPPGNAGAATLATGSEPYPALTVRTARLDDVAADWPSLRLMKIDVEGAEAAVIEGARQTLARLQPIVIFETNRESGDQLRRRLAALDYEIRGIARSFLRLRTEPAAPGATYHDCIALPREIAGND
ncbi:FkbM family methyltransferase [Amphiplicatus metriothermophilus]|uniref:Methyltransferase, FkbM family n=1 Tax=Amphiplicatus metriothermophilus TaxID=1519374 RepID=A0A239PPE9_9PROT|nr:FkbM family methyltransferase [Amphiplicatus metriothermophilus]MBB5518698.1 FkbM family methyltransferase [Amphiplicatus metriothermophilus]SNT72145.1 methyltransferase, FkbM family [Amphiplicatus metriothermophilus]